MRKSELVKIIKEEYQKLIKEDSDENLYLLKHITHETPKDFNHIKKMAILYKNLPIRITYGTRTKKFHFIDKNDRDWNTPFAVTPHEFEKFKTEKEAIDALTAPMRIKNEGKILNEDKLGDMMK